MKCERNLVFLVMLVLVSSLIVFLIFKNYLDYEEKKYTEDIMDRHLKDLQSIINKNKKITLIASILLSKSESIKECLKMNDERKCISYLQQAKGSLINSSIFDDLKIHLHKENLNSFFRLWDLKNIQNDALESFRDSLNVVKKVKEPLSCIEVGRYSMLIRGISPIIEDEHYLGSIETIMDFESIIKYFKKKKVKLYILMDKKYEKIASKVHFTKKQKLKNYIVLNDNEEDFTFLDDIKFVKTEYMKKGKEYIISCPIYNIKKEKIGFYVMKIDLVKKYSFF